MPRLASRRNTNTPHSGWNKKDKHDKGKRSCKWKYLNGKRSCLHARGHNPGFYPFPVPFEQYGVLHFLVECWNQSHSSCYPSCHQWSWDPFVASSSSDCEVELQVLYFHRWISALYLEVPNHPTVFTWSALWASLRRVETFAMNEQYMSSPKSISQLCARTLKDKTSYDSRILKFKDCSIQMARPSGYLKAARSVQIRGRSLHNRCTYSVFPSFVMNSVLPWLLIIRLLWVQHLGLIKHLMVEA